MKLTITHD